MRKCLKCHMRRTKTQISLRIRAVISAPLLFAAKTECYLYFIYPKFQDLSWSLSCDLPGRRLPKTHFLMVWLNGNYMLGLGLASFNSRGRMASDFPSSTFIDNSNRYSHGIYRNSPSAPEISIYLYTFRSLYGYCIGMHKSLPFSRFIRFSALFYNV